MDLLTRAYLESYDLPGLLLTIFIQCNGWCIRNILNIVQSLEIQIRDTGLQIQVNRLKTYKGNNIIYFFQSNDWHWLCVCRGILKLEHDYYLWCTTELTKGNNTEQNIIIINISCYTLELELMMFNVRLSSPLSSVL